MKKRHETRRGIEIKKLDLSDFLADGQEIEEALSELYSHEEPDWDQLADIAEMSDFAERGLRIF